MRRLAFGFVLLLTACSDSSSPSDPVPPVPQNAILDAVHGAGRAGFYFLPPLVGAPEVRGVFDATLSPRVQVCAWEGDGCRSVVADFSMSTGTGSESIRVDPGEGHYIVNWKTTHCVWGPCTLDGATLYRIRVLAGRAELGYADVQLHASAKEAKNASTGDVIPLVNGRTLPVKFRIEKGAVSVLRSPSDVGKIGTAGGAATTADGKAGVVVPPGAVSKELGLSIVEADASGYPETDTPVGPIYEFGPDGAAFSAPVTLSLAYDPAALPEGVIADMLALFTVENGEWVGVPGSGHDPATLSVTGEVSHFSPFRVGVRRLRFRHVWLPASPPVYFGELTAWRIEASPAPSADLVVSLDNRSAASVGRTASDAIQGQVPPGGGRGTVVLPRGSTSILVHLLGSGVGYGSLTATAPRYRGSALLATVAPTRVALDLPATMTVGEPVAVALSIPPFRVDREARGTLQTPLPTRVGIARSPQLSVSQSNPCGGCGAHPDSLWLWRDLSTSGLTLTASEPGVATLVIDDPRFERVEASIQVEPAGPAGPIHHWPGDGDAQDVVGQKHGALFGGASFAEGLAGQAFSFDGVNDYLDVGQPYDLEEGTLEFFFRRRREGVREVLTGSYNGAANRGPTFWFENGSDQVLVEFGGLIRSSVGRVIGVGGWHHLAMTWARQPQGGHAVRAYVDGRHAGSWTATGLENPATTFFGAYHRESATLFAAVLLDEIRVFDRVLSPEEVESAAAGGVPDGPAASVVVRPSNVTLQPGQTATTHLEVHQANGYPVPGATPHWTSSAPSVATVSAQGVITAVAPGTASVVASVNGVEAVVSVTVPAPVQLPLPGSPVLSVGDYHSCLIDASGSVSCWGLNYWKNNDIPPGSYAAVSAGQAKTCVLTRSGEVWCRGYGINGPGRTFRAPEGRHVVQVDAGWERPCALLDSGSVMCWDGDGNPSMPLSGGPFRHVESGSGYVCALDLGGRARCEGYNSHGQTNAPPVALESMSLLIAHACGLDEGRGVRCWGFNDFAQASPPSGVFVDVSAGVHHSCALTDGREVRCWGTDEGGSFASPGGPFETVGAGWKHNCALTMDGRVRCWGDDQYGQLSVPGAIAAPIPVIAPSPGEAQISVVRGESASTGVQILDAAGGTIRNLRLGAPVTDCNSGAAYAWVTLSWDEPGQVATFTASPPLTTAARDYAVCLSFVAEGATPHPYRLTVTVTEPIGLIHWWKGNGDAKDAVGDLHGTTGGGVGFAPGVHGEAFSFDGTGHLRVGQPYDLEAGTLSFWVQRRRSNVREVLTGSYNGGSNRGPTFWFESGDELLVEFGSAFRLRTLTAIAPGAWRHLAMTWERVAGGGHSVRAYVDGVQVGAWSASGLVNPADAFFGANNFGGASLHAEVLLDEIKVFSRALSAQELVGEAGR